MSESMQSSGESLVSLKKIPMMRARRRYGVIIWLLALGIGVLGACAAKQSAAPRSPEAAAAWKSDASVEDLERALSDEEQRLRAAGIALPVGPVASQADVEASTGATDDFERTGAEPTQPMAEPVVPTSSEEGIESSHRGPQQASRRHCRDVCDLAASICDLEAQICSLADRHAEEVRYRTVCQRASVDCDAAEEACNVCE
ncbi:MAG TPA: hypothetical protein ENJ18_02665 [Nannocystis exedens]|nr:hypothetical protein [Nannocystis exedens]